MKEKPFHLRTASYAPASLGHSPLAMPLAILPPFGRAPTLYHTIPSGLSGVSVNLHHIDWSCILVVHTALVFDFACCSWAECNTVGSERTLQSNRTRPKTQTDDASRVKQDESSREPLSQH